MEHELFERVSVDETTPTLDEKIQQLIEPLHAERENLEIEKAVLREQIAIRDKHISRIDRLIKAASPPSPKVGRAKVNTVRPSVSEKRLRYILEGLGTYGPITSGDLARALTATSPDMVSKSVKVGRLDGYVRLAGHSPKRGGPELWALTPQGEAFLNGGSHG